MQNLLKAFPENIKQIFSAGAPILVVIILFIVVGKFGVPKVLDVRSEIKSAQNTEKTLTQKISTLQTLSSSVAPKAGVVSSALPDTNPSLAVTSQLKSLALSQGVVLTGMKAGSGVTSGTDLHEINVAFTLYGARQQISNFLGETAKIAPITTIRKINITGSGGGVSADINAVSYWADLPKTIPSVTEPITELTQADNQILNNISNLTQPSFMEITPSEGDINPNPFGP